MKALPSDHPLATSWSRLVAAAATDLASEAEPWKLIEFAPTPQPLRTVPAMPGPKIYAIPEGRAWFYVGLTCDTLRSRLTSHFRRDRVRQLTWPGVMVLALRDEVSVARLGELERTGKEILRPLMGKRWSRG